MGDAGEREGERDWTRGAARVFAAAALVLASVAGAVDGLADSEAAVGEAGVARLEARAIDINSAGTYELMLVPGIGPALAGRIVEHREVRGAFRRVEDLDRVSGIGERTVRKVRPFVTVGGGADGAGKRE